MARRPSPPCCARPQRSHGGPPMTRHGRSGSRVPRVGATSPYHPTASCSRTATGLTAVAALALRARHEPPRRSRRREGSRRARLRRRPRCPVGPRRPGAVGDPVRGDGVVSRLMAVALTSEAVSERRKTVTRRKGGWRDKNGRRLLKPGDTLTLCRKVQGRKPGEPIERLAEVEVTRVTREPLRVLSSMDREWYLPQYAAAEMAREGFPGLPSDEFLGRYFIDAQGISVMDDVTRIEWRYVCGSGFCECGGCVL